MHRGHAGRRARRPPTTRRAIASLLKDNPSRISSLIAPLVDGDRLRRLRVTAGGQPLLQITQAALDAVGSSLPVPVLDPARVRHELAVAWLWLGARNGRFGEVSDCLTRRELVARGEPGDIDLLLSRADGQLAVRILLSRPSRPEGLLSRCARGPTVEGVLFMVSGEKLKTRVLGIAERLGLLAMTAAYPFNMS